MITGKAALRIALVIPLVAVLLGALSAPVVAHEPLEFVTLAQGAISGVLYGDPGFTGEGVVVNDLATWQFVWAWHTSLMDPAPPPPLVDFDNESVVCYFQGFRPTSGYSCEIVTILTRIWGVLVIVELVEDGGPLQVLTNPFHFVSTSKIPDGTLVDFVTYVRP